MIRKLSMAVLVCALAACATPTPPEVAGAAARASVPSAPNDIWATASESVGEVQVGWIAELDDPLLTALVEEAQANNKNLIAAAANVERSWALAGQAGAALVPSVSLSTGGDVGGPLEGRGSESFNIGLQASWEADVWGRVRAGNQAAVLSAQSAEADYLFTQYSLAAAVARAYFLAIEAGQQVEVTSNTLEALTETDRIVNVQREFGLATSQDVALSRSDLASTRASLAAAEGSQRDALRALEVLLGRYPAADLDVRTTLPDVPPQPQRGFRQRCLSADQISSLQSVTSPLPSTVLIKPRLRRCQQSV